MRYLLNRASIKRKLICYLNDNYTLFLWKLICKDCHRKQITHTRTNSQRLHITAILNTTDMYCIGLQTAYDVLRRLKWNLREIDCFGLQLCSLFCLGVCPSSLVTLVSYVVWLWLFLETLYTNLSFRDKKIGEIIPKRNNILLNIYIVSWPR